MESCRFRSIRMIKYGDNRVKSCFTKEWDFQISLITNKVVSKMSFVGDSICDKLYLE